jgi:hypothetical protein
VRRTLTISLLLLVFTWPVETAIAAVVMASDHACCHPKAAPSCHEHHKDGSAIQGRHTHDQCPMDCCSRRQASGNAAIASASELRVMAEQQQTVLARKLVAHSSCSNRIHSERGPPSFLL